MMWVCLALALTAVGVRPKCMSQLSKQYEIKSPAAFLSVFLYYSFPLAYRE